MAKGTAHETHYGKMTEAPVADLVPNLAIPSIIGMTISAIYNMADTFFASQINISASGAVGIVFSIMAIIQANGFALSMGSGSLVSQYLGAPKKEKADAVACVGFFSSLVIGSLIAVGGTVFQKELVHFLGSIETISNYAQSYVQYILLAAPLMCATYQMNNVLRSEGYAALGTIPITTGGILNIILDPIFISSENCWCSRRHCFEPVRQLSHSYLYLSLRPQFYLSEYSVSAQKHETAVGHCCDRTSYPVQTRAGQHSFCSHQPGRPALW